MKKFIHGLRRYLRTMGTIIDAYHTSLLWFLFNGVGIIYGLLIQLIMYLLVRNTNKEATSVNLWTAPPLCLPDREQRLVDYRRDLITHTPNYLDLKGSVAHLSNGINCQKCQSCHQTSELGVHAEGGRSYIYPPLWGKGSYNERAGLFRLSNLAGYVRYNMPLDATYNRPQLTDEEAWDVVAFINSQAHPLSNFNHDWPHLASKPFDHPFSPYADPFSEQQHKYGPFKPITRLAESPLEGIPKTN